MSTDADEPRLELTEAELERLAAERGLDLAPSDRPPVLIVARFLQRAAARLAQFESDNEDRS